MNDAPAQTEPRLPPVLVALFRGVLYQDQSPTVWQDLLHLEAQVRDQAAQFGLELMLYESEGYAFLRQRDPEDDENALPRLVPRRALSYPVSLLLALLRKKLAEHDAAGGEARLIIERDQVVELLRLFLPETANEARLVDRVDTHINKAVELGFLRRLRGQQQRYEVRRILAAFVDAQWLSEFEARLAAYRAHIDGSDDVSDDNGGADAGEA